MILLRQAAVALLLLASSFISSAPTPLFSKAKALVLISFDGFRYDTLNATIAPNITAWAAGGVHYTNGVKSQAVTFTAPNHLSIITGLHEDAHGIVGNVFFDAEKKQFWDIYGLSKLPGIDHASRRPEWFPVETIWQANEKAGGSSVVLHWPVGDTESGDTEKTTFHAWMDNGNVSSWQDEVEIVVGAIAEGKNLVTWYVSEPDHTLHGEGFYHGGHYRRVMADLDVTFGYFLNRLKEMNLFESTDIIFTADHGHAEVRGLDMVLCMDDFIEGRIGQDYQVSDHTVLAYSEEQAKAIYDKLSEVVVERKLPVRVMWTKDVPASWHFSHPSRLGQVMVVPEIGADARFICPWKDPAAFHSSAHGHAPDNAEMRAVLAMRGPSFGVARTMADIPQNIDLFPLMGQVLGIPLPSHNGTLRRLGMPLGSVSEAAGAAADNNAEEVAVPMDSTLAAVINIALIVMPIAVLSLILYYVIMRVKRGPTSKLPTRVTAEATEPML